MNFRRALPGTIAAVISASAIFLSVLVHPAAAVSAEADSAASEQTARPPDDAIITYRKTFKNSYPEFTEIKLGESGSGTYDIRQLDDDPSPQPFEIGAPVAQKIFDLASKLHNFQGLDLEVHHRLANLGEKTFRYEKGGENHEVTFNYTLDTTAAQLLQTFEGLARQEMDLADLQRTMHYDHLGVNDVLIQIESDYNNKILPQPQGLLDTLDQLAADQKFIDIARQRARTLASRIRTTN